jgi:WD40 repeat protein
MTPRELCINDMKVICNLTLKKRYQNYNLDGHTDNITTLDIRGNMIVSGGKDNTVKVWDIDRKKGWTFTGKHMNMITKVILWDEFSAFSASIDKSIRYFDVRDWGPESEQPLNGRHFSKFFMGHKKSIT